MTHPSQPLVSVVTPVYNGAKYLAGCIESVLAQTYQNWEYIILDNHSADGTRAIAEEYASRDRRLRVFSNAETVGVIENHNVALRRIDATSMYTKIVHADDLLFPDCVTRMVEVAERAQSVGLVGAYTLKGAEVVATGLPYPETVFSGSDVCRRTLRGEIYLFTAPSSLLIRSDLIRAKPAFYNEAHLYADLDSCFEILRHADFGFVHQVLTLVRVHPESVTAKEVLERDRHTLSWLDMVHRYGPVFLNDRDYKRVVADRWRAYHKFLWKAIIRGTAWNGAFWQYHRRELRKLGFGFPFPGLLQTVAEEAIRPLVEPIRKLRRLRA